MKNFRKQLFISIIAILVATVSPENPATAQQQPIHNDVFWNTSEESPIFSQGGGIFKFTDPKDHKAKYFWYGVQYAEAATYRNDPSVTQSKSTFKTITCYTSTDLVNWTFEGDVLTAEDLFKAGRKPTWIGRLGVAYIDALKKYAILLQYGHQVLFLTSDFPNGKFEYHQEKNMTEMIGTSNTGDQTVFTDEETGKSYLIYSYGRGRNKIYVSEIGVKNGRVDLLDCTKVFEGESREGNCLFKYKGKYYMCASNIYGWDASYAYYLVADDIRGPYLPKNNMQVMEGCTADFAHITQTGFFYTIKGSKQETVLYCGDRWANFAGNGLGYNQWFPLSFKGDLPYFNSLSSWNLDEKTGEWSVGSDNNYVLNGSFEADRRAIPSHVKPVQLQLTGWHSAVIRGNTISLDSMQSPQLNYFNTNAERKTVTGEKSLYISDKVPFERKVSQQINSTPFVPLPDGYYTMTAKIKNSSGFKRLRMYAVSAGKTFEHNITGQNTSWQTIKLERILVKSGKVEVGFEGKGNANAFCSIDDVTLVKTPSSQTISR
ncbi:MAG: family 43 glycosylhydrolase [Chitinophagaceae bacterium]